jgi:hypothetical protein
MVFYSGFLKIIEVLSWEKNTFTCTIRFVPYESETQRQKHKEMYQESMKLGETLKKIQKEQAKESARAEQKKIQQETPEPAPSCLGLEKCTLTPILQKCSHLRQVLERLV